MHVRVLKIALNVPIASLAFQVRKKEEDVASQYPMAASLTSSSYSCESGQVQFQGPFLFLTGDNAQADCEAKCSATHGCVAFDYTKNSQSDACRGVHAVQGVQTARVGHSGRDDRMICTKVIPRAEILEKWAKDLDKNRVFNTEVVQQRCVWTTGTAGYIKSANLDVIIDAKLTVEKCQTRCSSISQCKSIAYGRADGSCFLNYCRIGDGECSNADPEDATYQYYSCEADGTQETSTLDAAGYPKNTNTLANTYAEGAVNTSTQEYTCENNKNYRNDDGAEDLALHSGVRSHSQCANLCGTTIGCTAYVLNKYGACYLKASVTSADDDDPVHETVSCKKTSTTPSFALAPSADAAPSRETLVKYITETPPAQPPVLGKGMAEGCPRGHDCGYLGGVSKEPVLVPCKDGQRWMSPNALVIRGHKHRSAVYCSVPKVGTSYTLGVMEDLKLPVRTGNRNAGYENVGEIVKRNVTEEVEEVCQAYSFILIRNPWERIVSAYVDKVLTREIFKEPPSFKYFMQSLAAVGNRNEINQHFRPASELCHTSGPKAHKYDEKIKIEGGVRDKLQKIFITKLKLAAPRVHKILDLADSHVHPTTAGSRWEGIDFSLNSGLSRVDYYFRQSDPNLAAQIYKDDVEFGGYSYTR